MIRRRLFFAKSSTTPKRRIDFKPFFTGSSKASRRRSSEGPHLNCPGIDLISCLDSAGEFELEVDVSIMKRGYTKDDELTSGVLFQDFSAEVEKEACNILKLK